MVAAALIGELPADLTGARVLEVVPPGMEGSSSTVFTDRGAAEVLATDRPGELTAGREGDFGFVLCSDALRSNPYPMALLTDLWRLTTPGGMLLLEAEIESEPAHSGYARFVPAAGGAGWVPGRLALRWMIETCGFDVERLLGEPGADSPARLRATRTEREPARSAP